MEIEIDSLVVQPPGTQAPLLRVPSRVVPSGRRLALRGESGSGKTTFLHTLAGLLPAASGGVRLGDTWLRTLDEDRRCSLRRGRVGLVFQRINLIEHFSVWENLRLGSPGKPVRRDRAAAALESVGMTGSLDRIAWTLSLGQQQRVAVARVLVAEPALVLADEPTSALDDESAEKVVDALLRFAAGGRTLLVATHDRRIFDRFDETWSIEQGVVS